MTNCSLFAISPIDGRYQKECESLKPLFSEFGLMHMRLCIEIEWLKTLSAEKKFKELKPFSKAMLTFLTSILENFNETEACRIKQIENEIKHDVKAIEYYLREKLVKKPEFKPYLSFIHFAITSDDINNLAYAMAIDIALKEEIIPTLTNMLSLLQQLAIKNSAVPMLARTHGQAATPTTLGKELANFLHRLASQLDTLKTTKICSKFNGATGNFNAHYFVYPNVDWPQVVKKFIENFGFSYNSHTTQIEPHDCLASVCHNLIRLNNILINLCRDIWGYISLGYFTQKPQKQEVGSSTMPHKINPIDFENAEGNLGIATALFDHFANKLPISRWQRDLTDSTVIRNFGVAFSHTLLAFTSLIKGLNKLEVNQKIIAKDLDNHWEILSEAIQTMLRKHGMEAAYEKLKDFSRGKKIDKKSLHKFIKNLELPKEAKHSLLQLTPQNYLGIAANLANE